MGNREPREQLLNHFSLCAQKAAEMALRPALSPAFQQFQGLLSGSNKQQPPEDGLLHWERVLWAERVGPPVGLQRIPIHRRKSEAPHAPQPDPEMRLMRDKFASLRFNIQRRVRIS